MRRPAPTPSPAFEALSELDLLMDDVRAWGLCLRGLGEGPRAVAPTVAFVIGDAIVALADALENAQTVIADAAAPKHPASRASQDAEDQAYAEGRAPISRHRARF